MATVHSDGWPPVEALVPAPERPGEWPFMTQALIVPWAVTSATGHAVDVDSLQVMLVPKADWDRVKHLFPQGAPH